MRFNKHLLSFFLHPLSGTHSSCSRMNRKLKLQGRPFISCADKETAAKLAGASLSFTHNHYFSGLI